ncbi:MAG: ABC transporter permease [Chloracidobacterium sp.]|nr:ABC transporter permease [Chloracidobacterium sp.]
MPDWKLEIKRRLAGVKLERGREAAIIEELAQYLEDYYAEMLTGGATEAEAYRQTLAELSGSELLAYELRRSERQATPEPIALGTNRRTNMIADLWQDLRFGARMLMKNPGFTLIAVLTLALGIGANTAVFSFINALLFKSLRGVTEPERLAQLIRTYEGEGFHDWSYPNYIDYRDYNKVMTGLAARASVAFNLSDGREAERVEGESVSGNFFDVLGVRSELGRMLTPADASESGGDQVAVISYGLWRRRFNADPDMIGKTIKLNGNAYTVVGVADKEFDGMKAGSKLDVWVPISKPRQTDPSSLNIFDRRGASLLEVFGRLKPGVTIERANAEFSAIARQLGQAYPETNARDVPRLYPDLGLHPQARIIIRRLTFIPFSAVGIVLLIACANVAGLLMARANARRKEIGARLALGASRARIVRQLLTESLTLSLLGGVAGLFVGVWMTKWLISVLPPNVPGLSFKFDFGLDWRVFAFTLGASVLTGALFGLIPAMQASKTDLVSALKDTRSSGGRRAGLRGAMVVTQVALSFVLLIAAGLCVRTLVNARAIDLGYEIERVLTAKIDLPTQDYNEAQGLIFQRRLLERVEALPGVQAASLAQYLPLNDGRSEWGMFPERDRRRVQTFSNAVSHRYLETMKIPLLVGRQFNESDDARAPRVAIINETLQRLAWPDENPLGKLFSMGNPTDGGGYMPRVKVIGVARDIKGSDPLAPAGPMVYFPLLQNYSPGVVLHLRSTINPKQLAAAVRREVGALDPNLPVYRVALLEDHFTAALTPQRLLAKLISGFGLLALALAGAGLYGSLAYSVSQRTQDIGLRIALGARSGDVLRIVVFDGMKLTVIGLAIGLPASYGLTKLMKSYLYGVSLTDPLTFAVISASLLAVTLAACYAPARRATKVDPMIALRCE